MTNRQTRPKHGMMCDRAGRCEVFYEAVDKIKRNVDIRRWR